MNQPVMQSSLGEVRKTSNKMDRVNSMGYLAFGKVLKIHLKRYTADVQIYGSNDVIKSSSELEGRYACNIGVSNAGYDEKYHKPYGEIIPIQQGSIVLVGFLKNTQEKPTILRVFHDITEKVGETNYKNILTSMYPVTDDTEMNRYLKITRIQDFMTVSGDGNIEVASHTKTFMVGINNKEIDEENFDFENLSVKDDAKLTVNVGEGNSKPMKWLAVFRSSFVDSLTDCLRVIVDASKTSFKLAKQQQSENKLTIAEITPEGSIKLRRQQDTRAFEGSSNFSEIEITHDGKVVLSNSGESPTTLQITDKGVEVQTSNTVSFNAETSIGLKVGGSTINMTPASINIDSPRVNINE